MRGHLSLSPGLLIVLSLLPLTARAEPKPSDETPPGLVSAKDALGEDVLAKMQAWNSPKYSQPSTHFSAGGVHRRKVGKPVWALSLDDDGPSALRRRHVRGEHGVLRAVRRDG